MLPTTTITIITLYLNPEQVIPFIETHNIQKIQYHSKTSHIVQNLFLHHPAITLTNININKFTSICPYNLIHIQNCSFDFVNKNNLISKIFKTIQTHTNLTTLTLKYPPQAITSSIQIFKKLKYLTIIEADNLTPITQPINLILFHIKNTRIKNINSFINPLTLKRLIIQNTPIENINAIKECSNLISLILVNTQITLIPRINSSKLKKLLISESPINTTSFSFIQLFTHLTHLTLHKTPSSITSLTIPHLLTNLALISTNINNITTLNSKSISKRHRIHIVQDTIPTLTSAMYNSCTNLKLEIIPITYIKKFPSIIHLTLTNYNNLKLSLISESCKKLNKLMFIDSTFTNDKYQLNDQSYFIIEKYNKNKLIELYSLRYNHITSTSNNIYTIKTLELNNLTISSLDFLNSCVNLHDLIIINCHKITTENLNSINNKISTNLRTFNLTHCKKITKLNILAHMTTLKFLTISQFLHPLNFHTLPPNINAHIITLINCPYLTSIQPIITYAPNIHELELSHCNNLYNAGITSNSLKHFTSLSLTHCDKLTDTLTLNINTLTHLDLSNCSNLKYIPAPTPTSKFNIFKRALNKTQYIMTNLESLNLSYCTGLNDIKAISSYGKLNKLNISGCTGLGYIPYLSDEVEIIGARF